MQHWTWNGRGNEQRPKKGFETLQDCEAEMRRLRLNPIDYSCYVCSVCGKWHYGHNKQTK